MLGGALGYWIYKVTNAFTSPKTEEEEIDIDKTLYPYKSFEHEYWKTNYSEPESMDGIYNKKQHALYLRNLFSIEDIEIMSIVDFGFGLGILFREIIKHFPKLEEIVGIEPSEWAYELGYNEVSSLIEENKNSSTPHSNDIQLSLTRSDMLTWVKDSVRGSETPIDLGICTSVLQYIPDNHLSEIIPLLAENVRWLYLTVPTDKELDRQNRDSKLNFYDPYAIRRSREYYYNLLSPHFSFISSRFLESKVYFNENNTLFTDLLYRF